jgi:hypothetical protein
MDVRTPYQMIWNGKRRGIPMSSVSIAIRNVWSTLIYSFCPLDKALLALLALLAPGNSREIRSTEYEDYHFCAPAIRGILHRRDYRGLEVGLTDRATDNRRDRM